MIVGAVHKVRHVIFLANFDPPFPCHILSHIPGPPESTSHISDHPPIFSRLSTKIPDKRSLYKFCLNCSRRFCWGFCPGWFLSVSPSFTIHLLQQKVKHHFKFYVSYRLYRAQRLYVQLLSKSMLLAILIGNGIRLQSIITLCHEKIFFMSYFTRHKGFISISKKISEHKGCMSISVKSSEHKGCMSTFVL